MVNGLVGCVARTFQPGIAFVAGLLYALCNSLACLSANFVNGRVRYLPRLGIKALRHLPELLLAMRYPVGSLLCTLLQIDGDRAHFFCQRLQFLFLLCHALHPPFALILKTLMPVTKNHLNALESFAVLAYVHSAYSDQAPTMGSRSNG